MALGLSSLPTEIIQDIVEYLKDDHHMLLACSLTCHSLLSSSRPHLFSRMPIDDTNFDDFLACFSGSIWSSLLRIPRHLVLGCPGTLTDSTFIPRDIDQLSNNLKYITSLTIANVAWWQLPSYFRDLMLNLSVELLEVRLADLILSECASVLLIDFNVLSITGPSRAFLTDGQQLTSARRHPDKPFCMSSLDLGGTRHPGPLVRWVIRQHPSPAIQRLSFELCAAGELETVANATGAALEQLLQSTRITSLQMRFPRNGVGHSSSLELSTCTSLRFLHLDRINLFTASLGTKDVMIHILSQLPSLRLEEVLISTIYTEIDRLQILDWGNLHQVLATAPLSELRRFTIRLYIFARSAAAGHTQRQLEFLEQGPFACLHSRGILHLEEKLLTFDYI